MSYPVRHKGLLIESDGTRSSPPEKPVCSFCSKVIEPPTGPHFSTCGFAYLEDEDGTRHIVCYACCADIDRKCMKDTGQITLYLSKVSRSGAEVKTKDGRPLWQVSNWPGTLRYPAPHVKEGKHNWRGVKRYDVWFKDEEGNEWHGINLGDNQILRCKRNKPKRTSRTSRLSATSPTA